jgi:hypothetical protein
LDADLRAIFVAGHGGLLSWAVQWGFRVHGGLGVRLWGGCEV